MRRYLYDDDYWRIRRFLRETLILNDRRQINWDVARFDYWRWHGILNMGDGTLEDDVFIWETDRGEIAAVLNREAPGSVFLQLHPDHCSDDLRVEMIRIAEAHLTAPNDAGRRELHIWAGEEDHGLQQLLQEAGFRRDERRFPESQRICRLDGELIRRELAPGYRVRPLGDVEEHRERCLLSWRVFHPNNPEPPGDLDWYHNIQRGPLYRRDLDLVAVAPDGHLAAFATIWFDDVTRTGLFEPVGTDQAHQRKGLGAAVLSEGLRRLKELGADMAYVGSYTEPAHALYASVGFEAYRRLEPWTRLV